MHIALQTLIAVTVVVVLFTGIFFLTQKSSTTQAMFRRFKLFRGEKKTKDILDSINSHTTISEVDNDLLEFEQSLSTFKDKLSAEDFAKLKEELIAVKNQRNYFLKNGKIGESFGMIKKFLVDSYSKINKEHCC